MYNGGESLFAVSRKSFMVSKVLIEEEFKIKFNDIANTIDKDRTENNTPVFVVLPFLP